MPDPTPTPQMIITGERTVPGIWHENYWFRRHEVVYEWVLDHVTGRDVLEAGCGEGYGAHLLAHTARSLVAVDYDAYAVDHVRRAYPSLQVARGNLVALPFGDAAFDVVVSLQTVEHLWDQDRFVAECVRVLRPGGALVLSTPNTLTFPPGNIYHPHELTAAELVTLVEPYAEVEQLLGLHHGPRVSVWEDGHGSLVDAQIAADPHTWGPGLRDAVASIDTGDFVLHDADLAGSLDLVALVRARRAD